MAIYRLSSKIISRSKGHSAVACAAYRAGEKLFDERQGQAYDYTRKQDVAYSDIILPDGAPELMSNRDKLWNVVEAHEKRKDSQLAREVQLALPRELTLSQNIQLTREFVQNRFVASGMIADIAIHMPKASDEESQPHAHVLLTMRKVTSDGFGLKAREWNEKCELEMWRAEWCDVQNKHLALNGHDVRVDHRSLKNQGIDLIPQKKIGATGSFHRMAAFEQHLDNARANGEHLLENPEIALSVLTNQQSTFTYRDIARVVNRYTADGEQFSAVYEKVKASDQLVLLGKDDKFQERFTTKEMIKLETEMMGNADALLEKSGHPLQKVSTEEIAKNHSLSPEQRSAFEYLVSNGDLRNVVGYAGTGKSRLLGATRAAWEASGYRVIGATLSGIAAENLESSSGISSRTLASRLLAWEQGKELLTQNDILVIDEAGMLGSKELATVTEEANKRGAKLVLVGDPQEQLQAIQAGAAFRGIIDHTASKVELKEIWRQHEAWQKDATVLFSTRHTAEAIEKYNARNLVHTFDTQSDAKRSLIQAWNDVRISQPEKSQVMLAFTREDVRELNEMARSMRQFAGELGEDCSIRTHAGTRQFAAGEKIYFLKNDRDLGVKNGTLGTILKIDSGSLTVQLNSEVKEKQSIIKFSTDRYSHLDYGYASTVHKGQGGTFDRSFVLASRYLDRHSTNVAMTRHRQGAELFWSKEEFQTYDNMLKILSRDRSKDLSTDYLGSEFDKASFASYRGMDTLWHTFWEKYGSQWLQKMQSALGDWKDNTKNFVAHLHDQLDKSVFKPSEKSGTSHEDSWLKETRAWVEATFGKKAEEKQTEVNDFTTQNNGIKANLNSPTTNEQRLRNEERYLAMMNNSSIQKDSSDIVAKDKFSSKEPEKIKQNIDKELDI